MPSVAEHHDRRALVGGDVTLVEAGQGRVVEALEGRHHEQAPGLREVGPQVGMGQDVLDLDRAVERHVGELLVDGAHDPPGVLGPVEEVGVGEGQVLGPRRDLLLDVGEDRVERDHPDPAVVDDWHRAVPAPVDAAPAGLHDADEVLGVPADQPCVPVQGRQQLSGGGCGGGVDPGPVDHPAVVVAVDPGDELGVALPGQDPVGDVGHRGPVEAVAGDREPWPAAAHVVDDLAGDAGRGVHRDAARHPLGPGDQLGVPRLDRPVVAADLVAGGAQPGGRSGDAERLVAELVAGDEQHTHVVEGSGAFGAAPRWAGAVYRISTTSCSCAWRSAASTSAGVAPRANRNPR